MFVYLKSSSYDHSCSVENFEDWIERNNDEKKEMAILHTAPLSLPKSVKLPEKLGANSRIIIPDNETFSQSGTSQLEKLPMELLDCIIKNLIVEPPPKSFVSRNSDLMSLFFTSRMMNYATTSTLYRQIFIPRSRTFREFLSRIVHIPTRGIMVRRLDFSHFNPTGAGMTARERAEMTNLTAKTLFQCLQLTPNLREFLAQEHIDNEIDFQVLKKLFCHLPKLEALDLTSCSSSEFCRSFIRLVEANPSPLPPTVSITRLCLHNCNSLSASIFSSILPKLSRLTHLDVSYTQITDLALHSIPHTARITHLNISRCVCLTSASIVDFLVHHTAVKNLIYLNLAMDNISSEKFDSRNIEVLLPQLPRSLRSLNLKGSKMSASHVPLLLPLTKHLEELGIGRYLSLLDIIHLLVPDDSIPTTKQVPWTPHTLRYIDISDLNAEQLDLGTMFGTSCPLLKTITEPLEVLEINPIVQKRLLTSNTSLQRVGWQAKETGKRTSLVRERRNHVSDCDISWKWGVVDWGMRKIPVARAGEGGMYGYWMFKYTK
ncbi:hypothetical protein K3495_g8129 [Podosphaera aphanis]|nr:hypothetical protein K3495_g8129 [Podosphaera aphanis]